MVDSSVFAALPRMTWELFGAGKARKGGKKTAVSEEEKAAGIQRHAWVRMGESKKNRDHHRVRIIWLERPDKVILLATNLASEDAEALVVAEMYR